MEERHDWAISVTVRRATPSKTSKYKSLAWVGNEKQGRHGPHRLNSNKEKGKQHLILSYMITKAKKQTSKFHQPEKEREGFGTSPRL